jgi:hypothetical protein
VRGPCIGVDACCPIRRARIRVWLHEQRTTRTRVGSMACRLRNDQGEARLTTQRWSTHDQRRQAAYARRPRPRISLLRVDGKEKSEEIGRRRGGSPRTHDDGWDGEVLRRGHGRCRGERLGEVAGERTGAAAGARWAGARDATMAKGWSGGWGRDLSGVRAAAGTTRRFPGCSDSARSTMGRRAR